MDGRRVGTIAAISAMIAATIIALGLSAPQHPVPAGSGPPGQVIFEGTVPSTVPTTAITRAQTRSLPTIPARIPAPQVAPVATVISSTPATQAPAATTTTSPPVTVAPVTTTTAPYVPDWPKAPYLLSIAVDQPGWCLPTLSFVLATVDSFDSPPKDTMSGPKGDVSLVYSPGGERASYGLTADAWQAGRPLRSTLTGVHVPPGARSVIVSYTDQPDVFQGFSGTLRIC